MALGIALAKHAVGKTSSAPLWSRSHAKYTQDFAKWITTSGVNDSPALGKARGSVVGCSLENPIADGNSKKRDRWRSEKSVRRYDQHARLLKEFSKLSLATREYGQLVINRMSLILEGSLPPRPPASKILACNRARFQTAQNYMEFSRTLNVRAKMVVFLLATGSKRSGCCQPKPRVSLHWGGDLGWDPVAWL